MAAKHQSQVGHFVHQFVPNLLSVVVGRILAERILLRAGVAFVAAAPSAFHVRVGQEYHVVVGILLAESLGPGQHGVGRTEFRADYQYLMIPSRKGEPGGAVFDGCPALTVGMLAHQYVQQRCALPFRGEIVREEGVDVFRCLESVVVVARGSDVRHHSVQPFEGPRHAFPHLPRGLVEHAPVEGIVVVLLHKVARAEHCLDVQVLHVVAYPGGADLEDALVYVVFFITLRVSEQNHGGAAGHAQALAVGSVLGMGRKSQQCRGEQQCNLFNHF